MAFKVPEKYRCKNTGIPFLDSDESFGNNGMFSVPSPVRKCPMKIVASDGEGWEHVSVSMPRFMPNWEEMCYVKKLFWDAEDRVVQFHPPESEYVNNARYCLHLWRPVGVEMPHPPSILVGDKSLGELKDGDLQDHKRALARLTEELAKGVK